MNDVIRRILIADDHHASRELLRRMLHQLVHADILVAQDGGEALAAYGELRPQIMLLDIDMPNMNGFAALEQIRAIDPKAFVVMISAHNGIKSVQEALKHRVDGYIVKPYSAQRVLDALQRYVAKTGDVGFLRREES